VVETSPSERNKGIPIRAEWSAVVAIVSRIPQKTRTQAIVFDMNGVKSTPEHSTPMQSA
jgi:hypothetical protein